MKKFLILLTAVVLFGANLINVNFFESKNKLDILFSLDAPFKGKVKKLSSESYVITGIATDKIVQKEFNGGFINSIIISPYQNGIKIDISSKNPFYTSVALTPDGYGIRFRIVNKKQPTTTKADELKQMQSNAQTASLDYVSYTVGIIILLVLAFMLWFIKKKNPTLPMVKNDMKVLAQKPIDVKNKIVLFEYQERKYLMLIGNTNVLLDVFADDIPVPKNEVQFDEMLKLSKKYDSIEKYIKNAEKLKEFDERI